MSTFYISNEIHFNVTKHNKYLPQQHSSDCFFLNEFLNANYESKMSLVLLDIVFK